MAPMGQRKADRAEKAAASPHWEVLWGRCSAQRLVQRKPLFIGGGGLLKSLQRRSGCLNLIVNEKRPSLDFAAPKAFGRRNRSGERGSRKRLRFIGRSRTRA